MKSGHFPLSQSNSINNEFILESYFMATGFLDRLTTAIQIAEELKYDSSEIIEAICKVADKFRIYPPAKNRAAWFEVVFREKLLEARADILAHRYRKQYFK
ncbi:MAG: hypothetical protein GX295_12245 [Syntrophomonadaceae bacterium]|nr:hypothetical protein [Syntrophomonadaceae bacterium]